MGAFLGLQSCAGVQQQQRRRGRPAHGLSEAAKASYVQELNHGPIEGEASYSTAKRVFKSSCAVAEHVRYLACQQVTRTSAALHCRVCEGKGSSYEQEAYKACNQLKCIKAWAVEAYALHGQIEHQGEVLDLGRHSWDIMVVKPAGVLIEVQGEQHISKLNTQPKSHDTSLDLRASRDYVLAAAAQHAGFNVVWLCPGNPSQQRGRQRRWRAAIMRAVDDKVNGKAPKLYMA